MAWVRLIIIMTAMVYGFLTVLEEVSEQTEVMEKIHDQLDRIREESV